MSEENRGGDGIRIAVPAHVPLAAIVFYRSEKLKGRTPLDLVPSILSWLDARARDPLRGAVRRFMADGNLSASTAPPESFDAISRLQPCPDCRKRLGVPDVRAMDSSLVVSAMDALAPPRPGLWAVFAASRAIARQLEGVLCFPHVGCLPVPSWDGMRLPADGAIAASHHVFVLQSFDGRAVGWVTTCGMDHFGLPELEAADVPPGLGVTVARILGATAQHLIRDVQDAAGRCPGRAFTLEIGREIRVTARDMAEYRGLPAPSGRAAEATARVRLTLVPAAKPKTTFLRISPPTDFEEYVGVFFEEIAGKLLPGETQEVVSVAGDDPKLLDATRKALERLPGIKRRFQAGLDYGAVLSVKHGVPARNGSVEYVWSTVSTWRGRRIQALLKSQPLCGSELRAGQPLEIHELEVIDWEIQRLDGTREGGYTTAALFDRLRSRGRS